MYDPHMQPTLTEDEIVPGLLLRGREHADVSLYAVVKSIKRKEQWVLLSGHKDRATGDWSNRLHGTDLHFLERIDDPDEYDRIWAEYAAWTLTGE
jgi:hypothetical protein